MTKATNKTKNQLLDENTDLRTEVKSLNQLIKGIKEIATDEIGEDPSIALGIYRDGKKYMFAKIAFNPKTKAAKIIELEDSSRVPEANHMALLRAKEFLVENMLNKAEKEGEK